MRLKYVNLKYNLIKDAEEDLQKKTYRFVR